jgi:hypothetical protein
MPIRQLFDIKCSEKESKAKGHSFAKPHEMEEWTNVRIVIDCRIGSEVRRRCFIDKGDPLKHFSNHDLR